MAAPAATTQTANIISSTSGSRVSRIGRAIFRAALIFSLRFAWWAALLIATVALLLKFAIAFSNAYQASQPPTLWSYAVFGTTAHVGLIIFMLYMLFISEGMILSAIQLKLHDQQKTLEFIQNNNDYSGHQFVLGSITNAIHTNYRAIIIGRQIFAIIVVVGLVFVIQALDQNVNSAKISKLLFSNDAIATIISNVIDSSAVLFVVSTVLPGWVCQLLPHFLAEDRSLEFSKLPLAKFFTDLALAISKLQAGWPSQFFLQIIQNQFGLFDASKIEEISVGDGAAFRAISSNFGYRVKERRITIVAEAEQTLVTDKTVYEFFSRGIRDIYHFVKVHESDLRSVSKWVYERSDDVKYSNPTADVWRVKRERVPITREQVQIEVPNDDQAELRIEGVSPERPVREEGLEDHGYHILRTIVPLAVPMPRRGRTNETFGLSITYAVDPLTDDNETADVFCFDVSKPIKDFIIEVQAKAGTFIRPLSLRVSASEEVEMGINPSSQPLDESRAPTKELPKGWQMSVAYPPVGSCLVLTVDERLLAGA